MPKIRWGLLSTAHINRRVIPAIRASRRGELAAVASRDGDKALAYAAQWDIPRAFASYEAMLAAPEIDAVYISLPNHLHAEWTIKALQAGKHVLCEKPFATSVDEANSMIAASHSTGMVLAEAFMYRHHRQTHMVEEIVLSGRLGEVRLIHASFSFSIDEENRPGNVRLVPEFGGGSLWDAGIYPVSYVRRIYGVMPELVFGSQWLGETGVDEVFAGQMIFSLGRAAQISCSFHTPFQSLLEIHGTEARLELNRPFTRMEQRGTKMTLVGVDGRTEELRVPKQDLYLGEVEDMHAAILDGAPTLVTLDESRDHIRIAAALYKSAQLGEAVALR